MQTSTPDSMPNIYMEFLSLVYVKFNQSQLGSQKVRMGRIFILKIPLRNGRPKEGAKEQIFLILSLWDHKNCITNKNQTSYALKTTEGF